MFTAQAWSGHAMVLPIQSGSERRRRRGYTLIELIIVMAIISILVSIAVPMYQKSLLRTKESMLHSHLFTLRTVIDEYTYDKHKAPQTLNDLVSDGYMRQIPVDPITGTADSWRVIMEDASNASGVCDGPDYWEKALIEIRPNPVPKQRVVGRR
jgi:general secretion pathway protein G